MRHWRTPKNNTEIIRSTPHKFGGSFRFDKLLAHHMSLGSSLFVVLFATLISFELNIHLIDSSPEWEHHLIQLVKFAFAFKHQAPQLCYIIVVLPSKAHAISFLRQTGWYQQKQIISNLKIYNFYHLTKLSSNLFISLSLRLVELVRNELADQNNL